jgi:hypothetical protein
MGDEPDRSEYPASEPVVIPPFLIPESIELSNAE